MSNPTPLSEAEINEIDHTVIGPFDLCELEDLLAWTKRNIKWRQIGSGIQSPYLQPDSVSALLTRCYSTIWACLAGDISTPYMGVDNQSKPGILSQEMLTMWEATLQSAEPLGGTWRNIHILSALATIRAYQSAAEAREWVPVDYDEWAESKSPAPHNGEVVWVTVEYRGRLTDEELLANHKQRRYAADASYHADEEHGCKWQFDMDGESHIIEADEWVVTAWMRYCTPAPYTAPGPEEGK